MKTCARCKESRTLDQFFANNRAKDKKHAWCKECCYAYNKNSTQKDYRAEWQRNFRKSEKAKEYDRRYRSEYHQSLSGLASKLYSSAKKRAKNSGIEFDLDVEWIMEHLAELKCEASGMRLVLDIDESMQHTYNRPSIDRKDNSRGYTKDNCQIVSVIYNKAKSDGTHAHVLELISAMKDKV